jgi:outer membrane biosynthesis protein TonB
MASNIGVKIANGEFYPILEENSLVSKKLILSTVHDNQPSVQIDLYRSVESSMADAQYIGSIVVDNIKPKLKGDPSIELVISSDKNGDIVADAIDLDTSSGAEHHVLTVSLKSLDETSRDLEIHDFELESNEEPPTGLYQHASGIRQQKPQRSRTWLFILLGVIVILGLLTGWLFFLGGMDVVRPVINNLKSFQISQPIPAKPPDSERRSEPISQPEPVKQSEPVIEPEPVIQPVQQIVEPVPVIQAAAEPPAPKPQTAQKRPPPPVASYKVPATIPREGVNYVIRWGDTLWDISEAFYRDPWLYPRIAQHNNIRNPNYIISGRTIRVPPRN